MQTPSLLRRTLLHIIAAASSLEERLGDDFLPEKHEEDQGTVHTRLQTWCNIVARGNWELFQKRLEWDGWTLEQLKPVLYRVHLREEAEWPRWAKTLEEVCELVATLSQITDYQMLASLSQVRCFLADDPLPFEELFIPFIKVARQRLSEQAGSSYHLLHEHAHDALERSLLQNLASYAAQALHLEFSIKRTQELSPLKRLMLELQETAERDLYREYIARMFQGELLPFFQRYPVLARLLATVTNLWVEANAEFLLRLESDWTLIEQAFDESNQFKQVSEIKTGLSDPHNGRRGVLALTFASGRKLAYKPKNLGIDVAYNRLLAWCNQQDLSLPFQILTVIDRGQYGWVEFVELQRCSDQEAAQRYFQRAGMLLCLVYALGAIDCHHENLITHGEIPVLVDTETLLQHRARLESLDDGAQAQFLAHEMIGDSVMHTGFLPSWQVDEGQEQVYDISGLRGPDELEYEALAPVWEHINTDRMARISRSVKLSPPADYLAQSGVPLLVAEHRADVIAGFESFYRFLLLHRESLLAPDSPLFALKQQQLRLIYRNTHVYSSLFHQLLAPCYLQDGIERSIQLEALGIAVMPAPDVPWQERGRSRWWPIFAEERQGMQQMDVPFFRTFADSDALVLPLGQRIETCFREPSFDLVLARLQAFNQEDMERQVGFISGSLYSLVARDPAPIVALPCEQTALAGAESVGKERFVAHALRLAEEIRARAIRAADGSASWIVPQYLYRVGRYQFQPIEADLYSGTCGVALFLAAVEHITGGAGYRELALGALKLLRRSLRLHGPLLAKEIGIGAASGLASVTYTLTKIGQLLDEPSCLEDAQRAAHLITAEAIEQDSALDIFAGSAGAILGLLALARVSPDDALLEQAILCGKRLLESRVTSQTGYQTWPGFYGKQLTGFSHGAAGISYALLRLFALTGDTAYREAAAEAIAYEDSVFLPEIENWPDLRSGEPLDYRVAWCHGAPGIGLARLGGLAWLDNAQVRADIDIALQRTIKEGVQHVDHLCCGNMGRVDILLTAGRQLARPDLSSTAEQFLRQIVLRAEETGGFAIDPLLPRQVYHFGFFQGTSGFGYTLLRVAYPEQLPSVLLWQ
ncbi:MAG TPA: type 2 lanthipeptide synthetase LanM family protein [Ktedonobacteraceae bacterium]|nr:type 2 lanthipeptide synthetase LanM family protein [Ktedonobacteraceae bacterium]